MRVGGYDGEAAGAGGKRGLGFGGVAFRFALEVVSSLSACAVL